ncbi:MAG: hypothetical protein ACRD50_16610 [Candidatus Acidiferrales bacterium]
MASNPSYVKKQIAVDTVSWTPLIAPIDCMGVGIKNSVSVNLLIRTDASDATTQDTIPAGNQEGLMVSRHPGPIHDSQIGPRFRAGDTICFLQASSGTGPVLATFVA